MNFSDNSIFLEGTVLKLRLEHNKAGSIEIKKGRIYIHGLTNLYLTIHNSKTEQKYSYFFFFKYH